MVTFLMTGVQENDNYCTILDFATTTQNKALRSDVVKKPGSG